MSEARSACVAHLPALSYVDAFLMYVVFSSTRAKASRGGWKKRAINTSEKPTIPLLSLSLSLQVIDTRNIPPTSECWKYIGSFDLPRQVENYYGPP